MIKYQKNNIIFRIASADAISKFKDAQANSFLQLSRKELNFNEAAKEVVLLEYDRFSQLLFRVERICLSAQEGMMQSGLAHSIIGSFIEELHVIENVLENYPDVFTPEVISFTRMIHGYTVDMFHSGFDHLLDCSVDHAFTKLAIVISNYLQHLLIAMHEFNNNMVQKINSPFISIADFCIEFLNLAESFVPCSTRAIYFKNNGVGSTYVLKNYSSRDIFSDAAKVLKNRGITLLPEAPAIERVSL